MKTQHTVYTNYQSANIKYINSIESKLKANQSIVRRFEMFGVTTIVVKTTIMKQDVWASCQYR